MMKMFRMVICVALAGMMVGLFGCGQQAAVQAQDRQEKIAIAGAKATPKQEAVAADKLQNRAGVIYIVNGQEPFSGMAQDFYGSGQMQWEAGIKDGKVIALKRWHENGVLELTCGFTGGTLDIIETNAMQLILEHWSILDGEFSAFYDNGRKFMTATFRCGQLLGTLKEWTADGTEIKDTIISRIGMQMVRVASGTFTMGSPASESGRDVDEVQHSVTISKEYWLGRYEVTQGEWQAVMGSAPANFKGNSRLPVEQVRWDDAMAFCQKVTAIERNAGRLPEGYIYTLPTEAQWEYACRAGSTEAYAGDLDAMAWHDGNSFNKPHPVGEKQPNAWGFHDMHGNVWEWCEDWYGEDYMRASVTDPKGPSRGFSRVLRGGSWYNGASDCRSAGRGWENLAIRSYSVGFRLCLAPVRDGVVAAQEDTQAQPDPSDKEKHEELKALNLLIKDMTDSGQRNHQLIRAKFRFSTLLREFGQYDAAWQKYNEIVGLLKPETSRADYQTNPEEEQGNLAMLQESIYYCAVIDSNREEVPAPVQAALDKKTGRIVPPSTILTEYYKAKAVKDLIELVDLFPESTFAAPALQSAAMISADIGKLEEAIKLQRRLKTDYPESNETIVTISIGKWGWILNNRPFVGRKGLEQVNMQLTKIASYDPDICVQIRRTQDSPQRYLDDIQNILRQLNVANVSVVEL